MHPTSRCAGHGSGLVLFCPTIGIGVGLCGEATSKGQVFPGRCIAAKSSDPASASGVRAASSDSHLVADRELPRLDWSHGFPISVPCDAARSAATSTHLPPPQPAGETPNRVSSRRCGTGREWQRSRRSTPTAWPKGCGAVPRPCPTVPASHGSGQRQPTAATMGGTAPKPSPHLQRGPRRSLGLSGGQNQRDCASIAMEGRPRRVVNSTAIPVPAASTEQNLRCACLAHIAIVDISCSPTSRQPRGPGSASSSGPSWNAKLMGPIFTQTTASRATVRQR